MSESIIERLRLAAQKTIGTVAVYPGDVIEEHDRRVEKARQSALEEAAQIVKDCEFEATREPEENGFRSAMEIIAEKIRALISGAGNHASQQPHAGDGATPAGADEHLLSGDSSGDAGSVHPPRA